MTQSHNHWIGLAISAAKEGLISQKGGPFGAVIVRKNTLIASAYNTVTTSNDPTAHAEINAIRGACQQLNTYDLSGCILYSSCEPCPMCLGAILWARLKAVYYCANRDDASSAGFDDCGFYEEFEKPQDERKLPCQQLSHPDRLAPFQYWQEIPDKKLY